MFEQGEPPLSSGKPTLVDFHVHLDLYGDFERVFTRLDHSRIYTLAVTTTPRAWPRNLELSRRTQHVRPALGLHPQLVANRASELGLWDKYLPNARYVGEVGMDAGPAHVRSLDLQREVFTHVLRSCSRRGGKILTVHSTRAAREVLDLIEKFFDRRSGAIVLHWFTGTSSDARRAIDLGCYFSLNAEMFGNPRHATMLRSLPRNLVLTETDGPFTSGVTGARAPGDVHEVVAGLADLWNEPFEACALQVMTNLRQIAGVGEDLAAR